jgi:hypothetical protein
MGSKQHPSRFLDKCQPGDRVEVRKLAPQGVLWELATLEYVDDRRMVATLSDGARMAMHRSGLDVRLPRG